MCCEKISWNETEFSSLCWGKKTLDLQETLSNTFIHVTPYIYIYIDIYI